MRSRKVLIGIGIVILFTVTDIGVTHVYAMKGDDAKDLVETISQKIHTKTLDSRTIIRAYQKSHPTITPAPAAE